MGNVLITGVSAGLGQALAHQYSMVGHTVYGLSRDERIVKGLDRDNFNKELLLLYYHGEEI